MSLKQTVKDYGIPLALAGGLIATLALAPKKPRDLYFGEQQSDSVGKPNSQNSGSADNSETIPAKHIVVFGNYDCRFTRDLIRTLYWGDTLQNLIALHRERREKNGLSRQERAEPLEFNDPLTEKYNLVIDFKPYPITAHSREFAELFACAELQSVPVNSTFGLSEFEYEVLTGPIITQDEDISKYIRELLPRPNLKHKRDQLWNDFKSGRGSTSVDESLRLGKEKGVMGTPAILYNGAVYHGALPREELERILSQ